MPSRVRNSTGPLKKWPAGHLIMTLSRAPSVERMVNRHLTSAGHPGLLSGGAARPGRHRSLEALVSWSYELLGEAERRLLGRLSVLRGGFDLDVAERVAGGEPLAPQAVAGLLASLAGKSLVQVQAGAVIRYSLLETVRQFAAGAGRRRRGNRGARPAA